MGVRQKLKRGLIVCGTISVLTGGSLLLFYDDGQDITPPIFEEIPMEIQVNIEPAEPEENAEPVVEAETGEITRKVIEFTYPEAKLMLQVAQAEAGNQGEDGMWLVMSVIVNRMNTDGHLYHPQDDHSVEGTVYKKYSFSSVWDGRYLEVEISPECHEALARIESGDVAPEIVGFERKDSEELDRYFARAFEYKDHRFYTEK